MGQRRQQRGWWARLHSSYEQGTDEAGEGRPLAGYSVLLGGYALLAACAAAAAVRRGPLPYRPAASDLALLGVATFRASRILAKDAVMSPLRAPFTMYQGTSGPGEVVETPRTGPVRHAVGELLTWPFCLTQWLATIGLAGLAAAPRTTRWIAGGMTAVAVADTLQLGYARLQESAG
ncbi:DUF1360 domain-containing protein [Streptantibioticus rubrisoli]|uniref:DUF1360 domain-containing protein n=1 Tax=Streptantibioticus rubrisoli TaxID=1387313 RepID=A0ABT1PBJ4_9ACTN|nr:DUF1360 domain-containing protein [Streptantibioticus rubrisoli]MCQ4042166.1 DUF1360 domain-containing protein [Streptantibioticus rubrisoli]